MMDVKKEGQFKKTPLKPVFFRLWRPETEAFSFTTFLNNSCNFSVVFVHKTIEKL